MLGLGQSDDVQIDPGLLSGLARHFARIAWVDIRQPDLLATDLLHLLRPLFHLRSFLLIGRRDMHGQQMAQRIDGHMHLAAALAFMSVVSGPSTALNRRLQRAPVQHNRARLSCPSLRSAQDRTQVADDGLEAAGLQSPLGLLVDR